MSIQKFQVVTGPEREIEVKLSEEAHVKVMDRINLYQYEKGEPFEFYGEEKKVTCTRIKTPTLGRWFIIVDTVDNNVEVSVEWRLLESKNT